MKIFSLGIKQAGFIIQLRPCREGISYLLLGLIISIASQNAVGQTKFVVSNVKEKVAGYFCYDTFSGESAGAGLFTVIMPPKHGQLSYGIENSSTRLPGAVTYYTWTDESSDEDTDTMELHWEADSTSCRTDVSVTVQKSASTKNLGPGSDDCPKACEANPINVATGNKFQVETDFVAPSHTGLSLKRFYNSQTNKSTLFGVGWRHNWSASLSYDQETNEVIAFRADGRTEKFQKDDQGHWQSDPDVVNHLIAVFEGNQQTGWQIQADDDSIELYNMKGLLLSVTQRGGQITRLIYNNASKLISITGHFGHQMTFGYEEKGRIDTVYVPESGVYRYVYDDNNNLAYITYPNGKSKHYLYENAAFPNALTGIIDENNSRYATWTYDNKGRATSSQHADGADLTSISYTAGGGVTVTDALGNQHGYDFINQFDVIKPLGITGLASKNLGVKNLAYDDNGFVVSTTDFNNNKTVFSRDARGLEVSRTEAEGTPLARTISTQWHEKFRLPVLIVEPERETNFIYDNKGNLTQRIISDGRQTRAWNYSYDQNGQMISIDGPRNDVNDQTLFSYDNQGNLSSIVNALGHKTQFLAYDGNGRSLGFKDANGQETRLSYDQLGRLSIKKVGTESTYYYRNNIGLLRSISLPEGRGFDFSYDNAHRLTKISDKAGNSIVYTLDAVRNRVKETVYDPQSVLVKALSQQFDSLQRISKSLGAEEQATSLVYDDNDNVLSITDPINSQIQFGYDELNRLISTTDAIGNVSYNDYDDHDNLVSVTDSLGHITHYQYDGLDNQVVIDSPDTGLSQKAYDVAGNLTTSIDARGQRVTYSYDALNRLNLIRHTSGQSINFIYDENSNGKGRLTQMNDAFGTTRWTYDPQGRVTGKTFSTGALNLSVGYFFSATGDSVTYPSGKSILSFKSNGLISQMYVFNGSQYTKLLTGITYQPFGPPKQWLFGNGVSIVRDFDLDGRMIGYDLGERSRQLYYDKAGRIDEYRDSDMTHDQGFVYDEVNRLLGFNAHGVQADYSYDANSNRISVSLDGSQQDYRIDQASNRLLDISQNAVLQKNYRYDAAGNLIYDGRTSFTHDGRGRLIKASGSFGHEHYFINGLGQRVAKVHGSGLNLAGDADQDGALTATDLRLIVLMSKGSVPVNLTADCNHDGQVSTADATCTQVKIADMRTNPAKYVLAGTYFIYDEQGHLLGEYDQTGKAIQETVWLGDMPVAVMVGEQVYYVHSDHLNTPRVIMNGNGTTVWRWDSDAFGSTAADEDPDGDGIKFVYNLRFPGQYHDKSTGLHYNGFRDYDPTIGRYIQSDLIGLNGGLNTFGYVGQNPLQFVDSLGLYDYSLEPYNIDWFDPYTEKPRNFLKLLLKDPAPSDRLDVGGHGNPYFMVNFDGKRLTAKEVADLITAHPKYTKNITIRLVSCNVGSDPSNGLGTRPFAQLVAEYLETNVVEGPDFYVNIATGEDMVFGIRNYKRFTGSKVSGMNGMR